MIGSELRFMSMLFLGVVGFVLLICCANVANLLLARATVRARELAIRSALGAGRRRIIRQLMTESVVLSTVGGALGVVVGAGILNVAPHVVPPGLLPAAVTLAFDVRVLAFCAAAALLVGCSSGSLRRGSYGALIRSGDSGRYTDVDRTRGGFRGVLVAGEVATAVLLLFCAGLLLRILLAVENVDRGYRADQALTMMVDPLGSQYPTGPSLLQFFEAVEQEIMALPASPAWPGRALCRWAPGRWIGSPLKSLATCP